MRMEDLDPPREEPGAAQRILHSLQQHGLQWDQEVLWQSQRKTAYRAALQNLADTQRLFRCDCSRATFGANGTCAGHCQTRDTHAQHQLTAAHSLRVFVPREYSVRFSDEIQGKQRCSLGAELPNFIVKRKDGLDAYQLAVVVDDAAQQITHVVRGSDLLDSTARQIYLQQLLNLPTPNYSHLPVITNELDQKFSKQHHAPPLEDGRAEKNLRTALKFLQQLPPSDDRKTVAGILQHAVQHWSPQLIPKTQSIRADAMQLVL